MTAFFSRYLETAFQRFMLTISEWFPKSTFAIHLATWRGCHTNNFLEFCSLESLRLHIPVCSSSTLLLSLVGQSPFVLFLFHVLPYVFFAHDLFVYRDDVYCRTIRNVGKIISDYTASNSRRHKSHWAFECKIEVPSCVPYFFFFAKRYEIL